MDYHPMLVLSRDQRPAGIERPTEHDVLCGRGVTTNRHPGNESFRKLVSVNKEFYVSSTKRQKMTISRAIVESIHSLPGRFLDKDKDDRGLWYEISDKKAIEKTSQALRDGAATLKKQLSKDMGDPDFLKGVFDSGAMDVEKEKEPEPEADGKKDESKGQEQDGKGKVKRALKDTTKSPEKPKVQKAKAIPAKKDIRRSKSSPCSATATTAKTKLQRKGRVWEPASPRIRISPSMPPPPSPRSPHAASHPGSPVSWGARHHAHDGNSPSSMGPMVPRSPFEPPSSPYYSSYGQPTPPHPSYGNRSTTDYYYHRRPHHRPYHPHHSHDHSHSHSPSRRLAPEELQQGYRCESPVQPPPTPPPSSSYHGGYRWGYTSSDYGRTPPVYSQHGRPPVGNSRPLTPTRPLSTSMHSPRPPLSHSSLPPGRHHISPSGYHAEPPMQEWSPRIAQDPASRKYSYFDEHRPATWAGPRQSRHFFVDGEENSPNCLAVPSLGSESGLRKSSSLFSRIPLAPRSRPRSFSTDMPPRPPPTRSADPMDFTPPQPHARYHTYGHMHTAERDEEALQRTGSFNTRSTEKEDEKKIEDTSEHGSGMDHYIGGTAHERKPLKLSPRTKLSIEVHGTNPERPTSIQMKKEDYFEDVGGLEINFEEASGGEHDLRVDDIPMSPIPFDVRIEGFDDDSHGQEDPSSLMNLPENILKMPISPCGLHDDPAIQASRM